MLSTDDNMLNMAGLRYAMVTMPALTPLFQLDCILQSSLKSKS